MKFSLPRKNDFGVFQLSRGARVLCCKNGVVLHKTYLAICTDANKSVPKDGALPSREESLLMPSMHRFIAWMQSYYLLCIS